MERLRIVTGQGHPDFLDLPWHQPLGDWTHPRMATVTRGLARHIVRFVRYDDRIYALKETEEPIAEHEYRQLRHLRDDLHLPTVEPVGVVTRRADPDGGRLGAVLVTRFLDYSLPYQYLFVQDQSEHQRSRLLDALVVLLVRLHLHGFEWGDCSLANALFRRDAGALAAYLVDAETGRLWPTLADEVRHNDLEVARINIGGGLLDLQAQGRLPVDVDPGDVIDDLSRRYDDLWGELTRTDELDPAERWRVDERIRRINELGFDVEEMAIERSADGSRLWLRPVIVEEGHHHRALQRLTGLEVQENQARRLLNAIASYRSWLEATEGREIPEAVAAYRWLSERFEPAMALVPADLAGRLEPAEIYHRLLEHRWFLAEQRGADVDNEEAMASLLETVVAPMPDERQLDAMVVEPGVVEVLDEG